MMLRSIFALGALAMLAALTDTAQAQGYPPPAYPPYGAQPYQPPYRPVPGAPIPDVGSADALKKTLLAAKSIGYSTGPSGVYMLSVFEKLGIADQVKGKLKQTPSGVFVGTLIANGDAEVGFQQIAELVHFAGIDYVGPLPGDLQRMTMFSAGIHSGAKQADAARALVKFLTAPPAGPVIRKHGLEPA